MILCISSLVLPSFAWSLPSISSCFPSTKRRSSSVSVANFCFNLPFNSCQLPFNSVRFAIISICLCELNNTNIGILYVSNLTLFLLSFTTILCTFTKAYFLASNKLLASVCQSTNSTKAVLSSYFTQKAFLTQKSTTIHLAFSKGVNNVNILSFYVIHYILLCLNFVLL